MKHYNNLKNQTKTYHYVGEVMRFDRVVINNFDCTTTAKSEAQALNNIKFKAKLRLKLEKTAKVSINPGKLILISTSPINTRWNRG